MALDAAHRAHAAPHEHGTAGPGGRRPAGHAPLETALHPKKLVLIPGGHFDSYAGPEFDATSEPALDWYVEHLLTKH